MAQKKRKSVFIGVGALVQLLGLCIVWIFPYGTIGGIILFIIGSRLAIKYVCSNCGNKVDKEVKMCSVCREPFGCFNNELFEQKKEDQQEISLPVLSTKELMEKYGIERNNNRFTYRGYYYDQIEDAITYAQQMTGQKD